jgi:hypothetical protein
MIYYQRAPQSSAFPGRGIAGIGFIQKVALKTLLLEWLCVGLFPAVELSTARKTQQFAGSFGSGNSTSGHAETAPHWEMLGEKETQSLPLLGKGNWNQQVGSQNREPKSLALRQGSYDKN